MKKSKRSIYNLIENQIKILPDPSLCNIIHKHGDCHGSYSPWDRSYPPYLLQCLLTKLNISLYLFSSVPFYLPVIRYSHINHNLILPYPF